MGTAMFYHLTRHPIEETLRMLLGKAQGAGWRVAVRGTDSERLSQMDALLWQGPDDGFLPHGLAGGAHDTDQPILLTTAFDAPNGAQCLMAIDGAEVTPQEVEAFDRVCVLFDGTREDAVKAARGQWASLKAAGVAAQYWSEDSGRWEMKAQT